MEETLAQIFVKNIQDILSQTYQSRGYGGSPTKNGAGTKRVPNTGPGRLASSVDYRIEKDENGFIEAILIIMEDYWEVVDLGRRKNKKFKTNDCTTRIHECNTTCGLKQSALSKFTIGVTLGRPTATKQHNLNTRNKL